MYQHTDYVFRNAALYFLNLYEFSALFEKKQMIVVWDKEGNEKKDENGDTLYRIPEQKIGMVD